MIDHITIQVSDLEASKVFYEQVLGVLGYKQNLTNESHTCYGFGPGADPVFEIVQSGGDRPAHKRVHIAFKATSKEQIDECYRTAIALGATDNGAPGPRPDYTPTYYAAFVLDADENNIEVCLY